MPGTGSWGAGRGIGPTLTGNAPEQSDDQRLCSSMPASRAQGGVRSSALKGTHTRSIRGQAALHNGETETMHVVVLRMFVLPPWLIHSRC